MGWFRKAKPKENLLINEINRTKLALETAYSNFENVVDPDLIDSSIYELNAVQNRYKYLLKLAKEADTFQLKQSDDGEKLQLKHTKEAKKSVC